MLNDIDPVKLRRWVATSFPWGDLAKIYKEDTESRFTMRELYLGMSNIKSVTETIEHLFEQITEYGQKPPKLVWAELDKLSTQVGNLRRILQKDERVNKTDADAFRIVIDHWVLWLMERLLKAQHPKYQQMAHNILLFLRGEQWETNVHDVIFVLYQDDMLDTNVLVGLICDYVIPKMNQYMRSVENAQGKVVVYE